MVGQTRVDTTPITGYSTRTYKVITENGKTTEVLANTSNYVKRDKIVYVGTKQPAPQTPSTGGSGTSSGETASDGGSGSTGDSAAESTGEQTQSDS